MVWHYIENGKQAGPVDQATFDSMISSGQIRQDTQVWRDGMPNWVPYGSLGAPGAAGVLETNAQCSECGNFLPPEELVQIGDRLVCAACKPIAVQKLKEGVIAPTSLRYAGFWIRFAAYFVDALVMYAVMAVVGLLLPTIRSTYPPDLGAVYGRAGINMLLQGAYSIGLIGSVGSTLGMMACGIRVVKPDGEKIGYGRATGRFFAAFLSALILSIGYIMIAFDEEKRALHDRICDTRMIYKR